MKNELRRYTDIFSVADMLYNKHISLLDPDTWVDKNDIHLLNLYRDNIDEKNIYAYCLTSAKETYHHWQVFSGHKFGCCIVFNKDKLLDQFDKNENIKHGKVEYLTLPKLRKNSDVHIEKIPFIKRQVFRDEQEYRIIGTSVFSSSEPILNIGIDLSCIERIVFSPFAPRNLARSMKDTIDSSDVKFTFSTLTNNKVWRDYVNDHLKVLL